VKLEDSLLDSQNTISGSYNESHVRKFVENHLEIYTKIDITFTN